MSEAQRMEAENFAVYLCLDPSNSKGDDVLYERQTITKDQLRETFFGTGALLELSEGNPKLVIANDKDQFALKNGTRYQVVIPKGARAGRPPRKPLDFDKLEQEISARVASLTGAKVQEEMEYYVAPPNNPFRASFPKDIPLGFGGPDLLMFNLPKKVPAELLKRIQERKPPDFVDIESDSMDVEQSDIESDVEDQLQNSLREPAREILRRIARGETPFSLVAVSGSSKTRLTFEALCCLHGFFFTSTTTSLTDQPMNLGSSDLEAASVHVKEACLNPSESDYLEGEAWHVSRCLLLARTLIFLQLKEKLSPYEWLLVQLYPNRYFGEDYFERLYSRLYLSDRKDVSDKLESLKGDLLRLPAFVDEAQALLAVGANRFRSETKGDYCRSFLSPLVKSFRHFGVALVLSGTGLSLGQSLEVLSSSVGKPSEIVDPAELVFTNFGRYSRADEMKRYIEQFFPIDQTSLRYVFQHLKGRRRFLAQFVSGVLTSDPSPDNQMEKQLFKQKLLRGAVNTLWESHTDKKFEDHIDSIRSHILRIKDSRIVTPNGLVTLLAELRRLTLSYFLLGNVCTANTDFEALVECGVAVLVRNENLEVGICEPMVACAVRNYFDETGDPLEKDVLHLMGEVKFSPQSMGILMERYIIRGIYQFFSKPMEENKYFANFKLPEWFRDLCFPREFPPIDQARTDHTLLDFLKDGTKEIFFPEDLARHDIVAYLYSKSDLQTLSDRLLQDMERHLAYIQVKFLKDKMSPSDLGKAFQTTHPEAAYGDKKRKHKEEVLEVSKPVREQGYVRLLFVYPSPDEEKEIEAGLPFTVERDGPKVVNIYLSKRRSPNLFEKEVWDVLRKLKSPKPNE